MEIQSATAKTFSKKIIMQQVAIIAEKTINELNKFEKKMNRQTQEYLNGFDAGLNGASISNSNFSNFATKEQTDDWEAGQRAGKAEKGKGKTKKSNPRKK